MSLTSSISLTSTIFTHSTNLKNALFSTKHHSNTLAIHTTLQFSTKLHCLIHPSPFPPDQTPIDPTELFAEAEALDEEYSPWEGAIVYRRNATVSHVEYSTSLERLGLGKLSTEVSKLKASAMGMKRRVDGDAGTPVLVSVDVGRRREKKGLRLDGVVRSVITLPCNRCGVPAAEPVFSNFTLILTEEPIEEPETIDVGVFFGEDKLKSSAIIGGEEDEDDEASIDMDDILYFPSEEKEIDISKNIRDLVHLEITLNAICAPHCKGLCLRCGTNLNIGRCSCNKQEGKQKTYGPLGNLKKQMQTK